ncbi:MAG: oatA 2 [Myxococcaceae bacterium]|nr:oatA 2 [Myxococcaceae bacterium]
MDRSQARVHLPALDGIRGLAILTVVVYHLTLWANVVLPWDGIWRWTKVGHVGVDLFFVVSGYLITGILWDSRASAGYLRTFFARRTLRIFPLYYAFVFALVVVAPLFAPDNPKLREISDGQLWLWTYTSNIAVAIKNTWPFNAANHLWSLAVEEQFYLVWPLLVWRTRRETLVRLCFALTALAMFVRWLLIAKFPGHDLGSYTLTVCRLDDLLLGAALALEGRAPSSQPRPWAKAARLLALPAGLVALAVMYGVGQSESPAGHATTTPLSDVFVPTLWAVAFSGLVSLSLLDTRAQRWFSHPALRFFGRYSYGMYLFHFPMHPLFERLVPLHSFGSPALGVLVFTAVGVALTTAVAWISFHAYEARFLALKARFPAPEAQVAASLAAADELPRSEPHVEALAPGADAKR